MSPKASPWRNGKQESFFGRFKVEFGDPDRFESLAELMEEIYRAVAYYNTERLHSRHRSTPAAVREQWNDQQRKFSTGCQSPPHPLNPPNSRSSTRALSALRLSSPKRLRSAQAGPIFLSFCIQTSCSKNGGLDRGYALPRP